jgi:uncharacterized tellurite resistance protein B-like protein
MDHENRPHPARALDEEHRRRYLQAIAAVVYADARAEQSELAALRVLGEEIGLPPAAVDETLAAVGEPDRQRIDEILGEIGPQELRLALLGDAILVTYADRRVSADECKEIAEYADRLGISTAQAVLVGRYVEEVILAEEGHEMTKALAVGLADAQAHLHHPRGVKWLFRKMIESRGYSK